MSPVFTSGHPFGIIGFAASPAGFTVGEVGEPEATVAPVIAVGVMRPGVPALGASAAEEEVGALDGLVVAACAGMLFAAVGALERGRRSCRTFAALFARSVSAGLAGSIALSRCAAAMSSSVPGAALSALDGNSA